MIKPLPLLFIRLTIALSFFVHGLVRIPKIATFTQYMLARFEPTFLPKGIIILFSYALPFAEFTIGLLLLLGLFTRQALALGCVLMLCLVWGTALIEDWASLPTQFIHIAFMAFLLNALPQNGYAMDNLIKK